MESITTTFLGTSGSIPQKTRNFFSAVVSFSGSNLLFDCPEGTQRQLMQSKISLMRISHVFISHMHADHFLGLFGWIATMTLNQRKEPLVIFSPRGGKQKIERVLKEVVRPSFPIEFKELKTGIVLKEKSFSVSAFPLKHELPCFGFVFKEKDKDGEFNRKKAERLGIPPGPAYSKLVNGKTITVKGKKITKKDVMDYSKKRIGRKIVVVTDTRPIKATITNSKNADLLIHETTFLEEHKEKALEAMHSTALEVGEIAKKAKVKKLVAVHFSARINDTKDISKEVKKVFKNIIVANDFDEIKL
jgi:ribonuclease Z